MKDLNHSTCGCCSMGCACAIHSDAVAICAHHNAMPYAPLDRCFRWDSSKQEYVRVPVIPAKTERERQEHTARSIRSASTYHFECSDGEPFSAVAASEDGAFRVLNAERPGITATFTGRSMA
jgi:hypothetical protein